MSVRSLLLRLAGLAVIDAFALQLAIALASQFSVVLGIALVIVTLIINVIFLVERAYPWRWLSPGLFMVTLMVLFPLTYTVFVAFTNYGQGHLLTKDQAIDQFAKVYYNPP